jgi:hypothetical protein
MQLSFGNINAWIFSTSQGLLSAPVGANRSQRLQTFRGRLRHCASQPVRDLAAQSSLSIQRPVDVKHESLESATAHSEGASILIPFWSRMP